MLNPVKLITEQLPVSFSLNLEQSWRQLLIMICLQTIYKNTEKNDQIQHWDILPLMEASAMSKLKPLLNSGLKTSDYHVTNYSG